VHNCATAPAALFSAIDLIAPQRTPIGRLNP
jgi:hypothetical protein